MRITKGGNVGIGTTTDAGYKLDVNGTGRFTNTIISNSSTNALNVGNSQNSAIALSTFGKTSTSGYATANNYLQIGAGENATNSTRLIGFGYSITANTNQPAYIGYIETSNTGETKGSLIFGTRDVTTDTAPTERMRITSGGALELGSSTSTWQPYLNLYSTNNLYRSIYMYSDGNLYFYNGTNQGYLNSAGAWTNASDSSIKKDVISIKYGLSDILKLNPLNYKMKSNDLEQVGFIAQEVEKIIPELVESDNKGMKGISYGNLTSVLVKAIQELSAKNEALIKRIQTLENK
jgi:hypothetical protein